MKPHSIVYVHSGSIGDIFYSLPFCVEFARACGQEHFDFIIKSNTPFEFNPQGHPSGSVLINNHLAQFTLPLLQAQSYIQNVHIIEHEHFDMAQWQQSHDKVLILDEFRRLPLNFRANYIPNYYYALSNVILPKNFHQPIIQAPKDNRAEGKIVLFRSHRYRNELCDYQGLSNFASKMLFIGLSNEHQDFEERFFTCPFLPVKDALEAASLMQAAAINIGNQTGLFSIAEMMKVPRLLEQSQLVPNVLTLGGLGQEFISTQHLSRLTQSHIKYE